MHKRTPYLLAAALTLSVSACGTNPVVVTPPKAEPLDLRCDADQAAMCSGDCAELPIWQPEADGTGNFDSLLQLGPQDRVVTADCHAKLRACQACIERGRKAGVIR
jgi:hypothetical protein